MYIYYIQPTLILSLCCDSVLFSFLMWIVTQYIVFKT